VRIVLAELEDLPRVYQTDVFLIKRIWEINAYYSRLPHSGFTWHREAEGFEGFAGLRGTLYAETDSEGRMVYVREGCESLFKPGETTEALLKVITKNVERCAIIYRNRSI